MGKNTVGEEVVGLNPTECWFLFHLHSVASWSKRSSELEKKWMQNCDNLGFIILIKLMTSLILFNTRDTH